MKKFSLALLLILSATLLTSARRRTTDCATTFQTEMVSGTCIRRTYEMCCAASDGQIYCISWYELIGSVCPMN